MPSCSRDRVAASFVVRQELVQRRIEEADRRWIAFQRLENANEILALIRQQFRQRYFPIVAECRQESSRAWRRCGRLRRTCARCGSGRSRPHRRRGAFSVCSGLSALRPHLQAAQPCEHQSISCLKTFELLRWLRGFVAVQHAGDDLASARWRVGRRKRRRQFRRSKGSRLP